MNEPRSRSEGSRPGSALAEAFRPAPRLYFLRIPKTASTSMLRVFRDAYPIWRQCSLFANWHVTLLGERDLTRFRFFCGHWGASFLDLLPRQTACITLLRDPVEQVMSWFQHMVRPLRQFPEIYKPELSEWKAVMEQDLESALDSPFLLSYMSNMQTKFLGVPFDFSPWIGAGPSGIRDLRTAYHEAFRTASLDHSFARAESTLKRLQLVGITERFDESARLITQFVGVPPSRQTPKENIGPSKRAVDPAYHRARLSPHLLDRLEKLTEYDRELYRTAARMLEKRCEERNHAFDTPVRLGPTLHLVTARFLRRFWGRVKRGLGTRMDFPHHQGPSGGVRPKEDE